MAKGKYAKWVTAEGQEKITALAAVKTDEELAAEMGIACSTLYLWMKKHTEISEAITRGREGALAQKANEKVEQSLFDRCLGGPQTVMKAVKVRDVEYDATGRKIKETEHVEMAAETTYVPADTQAIKFWLTNRAKDRWKNNVEIGADDKTQQLLISLSGEAADYAK